VVAEGVRRVSPDTIAVGIFTIVGTLLGVALGLFGERWLRRWGDVRCNIDSWSAWTSGGEIEQREVEITFLNEKDLNAVVERTIPAELPPGEYAVEVFVEEPQPANQASYYFRVMVE
jgi:hypothetical protein